MEEGNPNGEPTAALPLVVHRMSNRMRGARPTGGIVSDATIWGGGVEAASIVAKMTSRLLFRRSASISNASFTCLKVTRVGGWSGLCIADSVLQR